MGLFLVQEFMHNSACFLHCLAQKARTCILLHIITMTKHDAMSIKRAVSDRSSGAVVPLTVTSEMIGAGINELMAYEGGGGETADETVRRIYLAMLEAALGPVSPD